MRQAPPLYVWVAAGALALGIIAIAFLRHASLNVPHDPLASAALARQLLTAPRAAGEIRVLGLGSSLLWAATPPGQFDQQYKQRGLHWMRLIKTDVGLGALGPSLTEIEHAPPDILVIEKNLFFLDPGRTRNDEVTIEIKGTLKAGLAKLAPGVLPPQPVQQQEALPMAAQHYALPCAPQPAPLSPLQRAQYFRGSQLAYAQAQIDPALVAGLLRLARRGVRIMILDIPRHADLEQSTASVKEHWFARLRQALPPGPALSYHTAPSHRQTDLYCDGAHLSAAGSRLFGRWWLDELATSMKDAP